MSLQVWLPLNGNLENKGLADTGSISSTNITFQNGGKIGGKYMTGKTGNFTVPLMVDKKKLSVTCWIKINTAPTTIANFNENSLFTWYSKTGSDPNPDLSYAYCSDVPALSVYYLSSHSYTWTKQKAYTIGNWVHIASIVDYENDTETVYINGEVLDSCLIKTGFLSNGTFQIGSNIDACYNDFRIYDHCLSEKEVKELSKGLVAHYPLNDFIGNPNLIPRSLASEENLTYATSSTAHVTVETKDGYTYYKCGNGVDSSGTSVLIKWGDSIKIKANTTYTYSAWLKVNKAAAFNFTSYGHFQVYNASSTKSDKTHEDVVAERVYVPSTLEENKWTKVSITFTTNDLANSIFRVYPKYNYGGTTVVCIRDQKLEEGSVATPWIPAETTPLYSELGFDDTTIYDTSGYGHNGTLSANPPTVAVDSPRYSSCAEFNGTDNTIDLGVDTWLPTDAITVSLWAYNDDWTSVGTNCKTLSCTQSGGWNFEQGTGGGYRFAVYKEGLTYAYSTPVKKWADYAPGWHLITGTFDKYVSKIYIDGEFDSVSSIASPTVEAAIHYNANTHLFIGCEAATANPSAPYFNGKISDVRIYCTALSPEDIKELYEVSASIDNKGNIYAYELVES